MLECGPVIRQPTTDNLLGRALVPWAQGERAAPEERRRLRRSWGKMLARIFEVDPLVCECGTEMEIIAFITEYRVVRRILSHLERVGRRPGRSPPGCAA